MDSEVYFVYGGGATVQMHAGSLVRPYNLMLATLIDHDDSDVSAGPGEFPAPSGLTKDRSGMAFWLRLWSCAIRLLSIYGCHDRLRSISSCAATGSGRGLDHR